MAQTMRRIQSAFGSGAVGILALCFSSCGGSIICPDGRYVPGEEGCAANSFAIRASFRPFVEMKGDLRTNVAQPVTLYIQARSDDLKKIYGLKEVPKVDLLLNGQPQLNVPCTIVSSGSPDYDKLSCTPSVLEVGLLSAQVTVPGLAPVDTDLPVRVYREPQFGAPESLQEVFNQRHAIPIRARVSVQIVNPTGGVGRVLVSEETQCPSWWKDMAKCGAAPYYRWLDLYAPGSSGTDSLVYANDNMWQARYGTMQTSTTALLAYAKETVLLYDAKRQPNPLSFWPQAGMMQDSFSTDVPKNATALAACADESALLLAEPTGVRVFTFDQSLALTYAGHIPTTSGGSAVIAARDVLGAKPAQSSADYFGVVFDAGNKITLLKLGSSGTGLQQKEVLGPLFGTVSAAALADLDSDGLQDLVVVQKDPDNSDVLMWSPQLQDGSFANAEMIRSSLGSSKIVIPRDTPLPDPAPLPVSLSVGDVNNDGLPDLAIATSDKHLYIYRHP